MLCLTPPSPQRNLAYYATRYTPKTFSASHLSDGSNDVFFASGAKKPPKVDNIKIFYSETIGLIDLSDGDETEYAHFLLKKYCHYLEKWWTYKEGSPEALFLDDIDNEAGGSRSRERIKSNQEELEKRNDFNLDSNRIIAHRIRKKVRTDKQAALNNQPLSPEYQAFLDELGKATESPELQALKAKLKDKKKKAL